MISSKMARKRTKIILAASLAAALLLAAAFFICEKTGEASYEGYAQGVYDSVEKIMYEARSCYPVPVYLGNESIQVVDISCVLRER